LQQEEGSLSYLFDHKKGKYGSGKFSFLRQSAFRSKEMYWAIHLFIASREGGLPPYLGAKIFKKLI
jgi:hypothetical protein